MLISYIVFNNLQELMLNESSKLNKSMQSNNQAIKQEEKSIHNISSKKRLNLCL